MSKAKKVITINLDKERHLYFNLNSLIIVEKETGQKFNELGEDNMSLEMLRALLYAGLKWEDKSLNLDDVGELIDFDNLQEVMEKLGEAMEGLKPSQVLA